MRMNVSALTDRIKGMRPMVLAAIVGAVSAGGAATVFASVPDQNGVIHACYRGSNVRIIDTATDSCRPLETAISWNQAGPAAPGGSSLQHAASASDLTLTVAESVAQNNRADLGGPEVTVTVPANAEGALVELFASGELTAPCDVYAIAFVIDETTNDDFSGGPDGGLVQLFGGASTDPNKALTTLGGGNSKAGFKYSVPAAPGTHTYAFRYKATPFDANDGCTAHFKNMKLWAELQVPAQN